MKRLAILLVCMAARGDQISGVVVDHLSGQPLNHVLMEITQVGKGRGDTQMVTQVVTQADGRFAFLNIPQGRYRLTAAKRGQIPESFQSTGVSTTGVDTTAIVVDGVQKTDGIVFAMRTPAFINGTVMGEDGEPVYLARITLFKESVVDGQLEALHVNGTFTNAAGQFRLAHLEAGAYYLAVQGVPWFANNSPPTNEVYPVTFFGDTTDPGTARVIRLKEGGSATVQINLHTVTAITVKLSDIDLIHQLRLSVPCPGGARLIIGTNVMSTVPGQFELINLVPGRYLVTNESRQFTRTIELQNGSTLSLDDADHSPAAVSGKVVFDGPRPAVPVELWLGFDSHAEVGADGTFKFNAVMPGIYQLRVDKGPVTIAAIQAQGARVVQGKLAVSSGAAVDLTVHAVANQTLATLDGIAIADGSAVAGAMVLLLPRDSAGVDLIRHDQSGTDGRFHLSNVVPGDYLLIAIDDGKDLVYKDESVIRPYLERALPLNVPHKAQREQGGAAKPMTNPQTEAASACPSCTGSSKSIEDFTVAVQKRISR
jgi:5-hydroxyisourate hydrolase-like protein (transthyretin family)